MALSSSLFVGLLLAFVCSAALASPADESIVLTKNGRIKGVVTASARSFKGIPYGAPPSRFKPPRPAASWSNTFSADSFGPGCPQDCWLPDGLCPENMSEDCLNVNVFTPRLSPSRNVSWPVIVFIHGGGFDQGAGGCALFDGTNFVQGNVILVTFNYRLGALGFFYDGTGSQGNFGLLDQQLALKWVQENIAAFGGNPQKITIAGESAGAVSTMTHLTSPSSSGLFQSALLMSNPWSLPLKNRKYALKVAGKFSSKLDCLLGDTACVAGKPLSQILKAQEQIEGGLNIFHPAEFFLLWGPVVLSDPGALVPQQPVASLAAGNYSKVPVLIGTDSQEGIAFAYSAFKSNLSSLAYVAVLTDLFLDGLPGVLGMYPGPIVGDKRPVLSVLLTDYIFYCPTRFYTKKILQSSGFTPYIYVYDHAFSVPGMWGRRMQFCEQKVCHGAEMGLLFNSPYFNYLNFTAAEKSLAKSLVSYWSNFAQSSSPSEGSNNVQVRWPSFAPTTQNLLLLRTPLPQPLPNPRGTVCDFWDTMGSPPYRFGW